MQKEEDGEIIKGSVLKRAQLASEMKRQKKGKEHVGNRLFWRNWTFKRNLKMRQAVTSGFDLLLASGAKANDVDVQE